MSRLLTMLTMLLAVGCSASPGSRVCDEQTRDAVFAEEQLPPEWQAFTAVNADYFVAPPAVPAKEPAAARR